MIPGLISIFYKARTIGSFSATASPPAVNGNDTAGPVTSSSTTAIPSGGTGPFTYLWVYYTGDPHMAPTAGTSATTSFSENLFANSTTSAQYFCRVTDSTSAVVNTNLVTATLHASAH